LICLLARDSGLGIESVGFYVVWFHVEFHESG